MSDELNLPEELPPCSGCYVTVDTQPRFLPQVEFRIYAHILGSVSHTTLTQTFSNPSHSALDQVRYMFPLYDGASVVSFACSIGESIIKGIVKERVSAQADFDAAVEHGKMASLLRQSHEASDVFATTIGNIPAGNTVRITISYLGELKHDAEVDGLRFTVPTSIAPRYSAGQSFLKNEEDSNFIAEGSGITSMVLDVEMPEGSTVKSIQSPSHPLSVSIGTTSIDPVAEPLLRKASANLSLNYTQLKDDIVINITATNIGNPTAILETHPSLPDQYALMTTFVPKFQTPNEKPEIVFVCDRSGSMSGKMPGLITALKIFLKSLPLGLKFNICSFGSKHEFLWERSESYNAKSLERSLEYIQSFQADYGGTELYAPVEETFQRRYPDMNLELFILTDGEIWHQDELFHLINENVAKSDGRIRVFSLGVGARVSHALIEGVARAGNGFSQTVGDNENMDNKVVRMLKGALTPHVRDYALKIKYKQSEDSVVDEEFREFELVENPDTFDLHTLQIYSKTTGFGEAQENRPPVSLFDTTIKDSYEDTTREHSSSDEFNYDCPPTICAPRCLQTPFNIASLFPFSRATVYMLLSECPSNWQPRSVLLQATSTHGLLELEIPITIVNQENMTIHRLAARNVIKELEEGRGWIFNAKATDGRLLKEIYGNHFPSMVEREGVRLGLAYQVAGKWTSFVAVQTDQKGEKDAEVAIEHLDMDVSRGTDPLSGLPQDRNIPSEGVQEISTYSSQYGALVTHQGAFIDCSEEDSDEDMGFGLYDGYTPPGPVDVTAALHLERRSSGPFLQLVQLQTFTGSWTWTSELEAIIGVTEQQAGNCNLPTTTSNTADILATICTVVYLKKKLASEKDAWDMLVQKAQDWLEDETGASIDNLVEAVEDLFEAS